MKSLKYITIDDEISQKFRNMSIICAFMVVALHLQGAEIVGSGGWWFQNIANQICKMAVPFFFLMSGFLLMGHVDEPRWYIKSIKKRIKSLIIPFIIWSLIWSAYFTAVCCRHGGWSAFIRAHYINLLGLDILNWPGYTVLWYLRSLFIFVLLSPLFILAVVKFGWIAIAALWACDCLFRLSGHMFNPSVHGFFLNVLSLEGAAYFAFGIGLRIGVVRRVTLPKKSIWMSLGMVAVVTCFALLYREGILCDLSMEGFVIPVMILIVWQNCPSNVWPVWLTKSAFPIYLMHLLILAVLQALVFRNPDSIIQNCLKYCTVTLFTLLTSVALRSCFPRLCNMIFAGRC